MGIEELITKVETTTLKRGDILIVYYPRSVTQDEFTRLLDFLSYLGSRYGFEAVALADDYRVQKVEKETTEFTPTSVAGN